MKKTITHLFAAGIFMAMASPALADPIVGNWKTKSGETAAIAKCGGSFCIKLKTGKYKGKTIGKLAGANGSYKGTITDPEDDKQYSGSAKVAGASMKLKGCALKVFCQTQNWKKI